MSGSSLPGVHGSSAQRALMWLVVVALVIALPQIFSSGLGVAVLNQMFIMRRRRERVNSLGCGANHSRRGRASVRTRSDGRS